MLPARNVVTVAALLGLVLTFGSFPVSAETHGGDSHEDAAAHAEGHGGGHGEMNWTDMGNEETPPLAFMFINFALLVVLVIIIMRKPIGNMVRTRRDNLTTALEEANKLKDEAEAALAAARDRMEAMDLEMAKLRHDILEAGKAESARISKEGESRAARMEEDTKALVEQEAARMSATIREEVVNAIVAEAERVIAERMNAGDHERLAGEYVESMKEIASS